MALLRLMLGGAIAASAACGQAGAQPTETSGIKAPAGWQALPELATAIGAAMKGERATLAGAEAWGEPARGCYGVWLALSGDGASAQQVLAGIEAEKIELTNVVKPEGAEGLVAASFVKGRYHGRLRARVTPGRVAMLACFANDREPGACEQSCTTLLGGLP